MTTPDEDGEYLGDGVYATFDGYQVWLHTERDVNVWHTIAIEPKTFERLVEYRAKVHRTLLDSLTWNQHTLYHGSSGREHTFTEEEVSDARRYVEAHKGSPLDPAVLFDDTVHRFGSRDEE